MRKSLVSVGFGLILLIFGSFISNLIININKSEPTYNNNSLTSVYIKVVKNNSNKIEIAGKTGTARKYMKGGYSKKYISNFAGFFPTENPRIVGVVMLDEPNYGLHWGGYGAAPLFKRIAQRI